ncbi:cysteine hydrolase family protein [Modestobacter sp. VKM Ac-2984]|uniref:cysteine hydrolase family protein n=1 Tax=Modestobacter sp. VKM Ac-2984 TaxID=3004138 RepID=UPI0022AA6D16|nr:isochorismatase family protein [Modestobacter sp. VKM Ac-2984]MCZ2815640.1 isochorismatase family protein [Modestobacter sp. VKM Ac-2984]
MSGPVPDRVLVVVDVQHVFADRDSPWGAPRFAEVHPAIRRLTRAFAGRVVHTRFVAPAEPTGAWVPYYAQFPFALTSPDAPLYALVDDPGDAPVLDATTFGKWGPELGALVGAGPLVLAGVSTDCCVLSTALPAADAGVPVQVVTDACAGASDADHDRALAAMALYAPLITLTTTDAVLAGR